MSRIIFSILALLTLCGAEAKAYTITEDHGGRLGTYIDKFEKMRDLGEYVVIDGPCDSACTIVLGKIPQERICVTSRATLGFHAAWDFGVDGRPVTDKEATRNLFAIYPSPVKRWIMARGGLTPKFKFLKGKALAKMYKPCGSYAQMFR
jgi:hypothetical protein